MRFLKTALALTLPLLAAVDQSALAADIAIVTDLNPTATTQSSYPRQFRTIGSRTVFIADDGKPGLWSTDGTTSGTTRLTTVSANALLWPVASGVVFAGYDDVHGTELWITDGTPSGTRMLLDLREGFESSNPSFTYGQNGRVFFNMVASAGEKQFWVTDGTAAGTHSITFARTNPTDNGRSSLALVIGFVKGKYLFYGETPDQNGLFLTDGTTAGTSFVASSNSVLSGTTTASGSFLFMERDWDFAGLSLWKSDGTAAGTTVLRSGFTDAAYPFYQVLNGATFFLADDGMHGIQPWKTDGTVEGTAMIFDLSSASPAIAAYGGRSGDFVYLNVWNGATRDLWRTDGTAAGTTLVKTGFRMDFTDSNAMGLFGGGEASGPANVWQVNGGSVNKVGDLAISSLAVIPGSQSYVLMSATEGVHGYELWKMSGTPLVAAPLLNIRPEDGNGSQPSLFQTVAGKALFHALTAAGEQIWLSDGTPSGTTPLWTPAANHHVIRSMTSGPFAYFIDQGNTEDLWRTDGTVSGTIHLSSAILRNGYEFMLPFRGGLLFGGSDDTHGAEPWFTDGTAEGTESIDASPGPSGSLSYAMPTVIGDVAYYTGYGPSGPTTWRTDGTSAGSHMITNLTDPPVDPSAYVSLHGTTFFLGNRSLNSFTLWKDEGGSAVRAATIDTSFRAPQSAYALGDSMIIVGPDSFWKSDGTSSGTVLINSGVTLEGCRGTTLISNGILYSLYMSREGLQLWRTDGSSDGTYPVVTLPSNGAQSLQECIQHELIAIDGLLYFTGVDEFHGAEPWVSDGTDSGTHLLADVNPGVANSDPHEFVHAGTHLFFDANDGEHGAEPWAYRLPAGVVGVTSVDHLLVKNDGTSHAVVAVHLSQNDAGVGGKSVVLTSSMTGTVIAPAIATTDATGTAHFTVSSARSGRVTFTARDVTDQSDAGTATVQFVAVPPVRRRIAH